MADIMSGRDLTVIVLQQEEAEALMELLYRTRRLKPEGIEKWVLDGVAGLEDALYG